MLSADGEAMPPPPPRPASADRLEIDLPTQSNIHPPSGEGSPAIKGMVSRAKRLAGQIYMLLHAKNCRSVSCKMDGCATTKRLFRAMTSVQTGRCGLDTMHKAACAKALKLLQHHHDCRIARLDSTPKNPHFCLVCSLVDRARMAPDESLKCFRLDYSLSPFSTELPLSVAQRVNHSHNTRFKGQRRARSASCGDDLHEQQQRSSVSQSFGDNPAPRTLHCRRKRERGAASSAGTSPSSVTAVPAAVDTVDSLELGASLLSTLATKKLAASKQSLGESTSDEEHDRPQGFKRPRSATWGGEWDTQQNSASDLCPISESREEPSPERKGNVLPGSQDDNTACLALLTLNTT